MPTFERIHGHRAGRALAAVFAAVLAVAGLTLSWASQAESARHRAVDWPMHGLNSAETHFSPLREINESNVQRLVLAWSYHLESTHGVEATPIVVSGVMYVTAAWIVVHAIDARSGRRLWTYDSKVPRSHAARACCDVANRGVAVDNGRVFVASFDGRLIPLDARSGRRLWERDTIDDHSFPYCSTGAPRVVKGNVLIGNASAEYGVRGYLTAYEVESGRQAWRWFTVPRDPSRPYESAALARAAQTWDTCGLRLHRVA